MTLSLSEAKTLYDADPPVWCGGSYSQRGPLAVGWRWYAWTWRTMDLKAGWCLRKADARAAILDLVGKRVQ